MALREFPDDTGRIWKVWDVRPEHLHGAVRAEEYLQGFLEGWLVFESADGTDKCRLYPIPRDWEKSTDAELEQLRRDAATGDGGANGAEGNGADTPTPPPTVQRGFIAMRTFRYPNGRFWTVSERPFVLRDERGEVIETRVVLHFASGARGLELLAWPRDWTTFPDDQLADLLRRGFPRPAGLTNPTPHRRRLGDAPTPSEA